MQIRDLTKQGPINLLFSKVYMVSHRQLKANKEARKSLQLDLSQLLQLPYISSKEIRIHFLERKLVDSPITHPLIAMHENAPDSLICLTLKLNSVSIDLIFLKYVRKQLYKGDYYEGI